MVSKTEESVHLVPLTTQELLQVQFDAVSRMVQLNREVTKQPSMRQHYEREIQTLGRVVEKCSVVSAANNR